MKKIIAATTVALALATTASAELKVGLGYTISDDLSSGLYSPANIRVPIDLVDVGNGLRIEPELGFGSATVSGGGVDTTDSAFTLGVGGYYNLWTVEKVNFYAGGRLAIIKSSNEVSGNGFSKTTDNSNTSLQGLFGAEYLLTPEFTVAAQAGLEVMTGDDPTGYSTVGHLVIRYFFLGGSSSSDDL